jgi:hypothetical protein
MDRLALSTTPNTWPTNRRLHWPISPLPSKRPTRHIPPPRPLRPQLLVVVVLMVDSAVDMVVAMEDIINNVIQ